LRSLADYSVKQMLAESPSTLYSISGEDPIILAGVHLSALEVEAVLALGKNDQPDGIILGYCVLRLMDSKNLWSVFYQTKISTVKLPVLTAKPDDNLQKMISRIMNKGWGYAVIVDSQNKATNLVGLLDLATFYLKSGVSELLAKKQVKDKASTPLFSISEEVTLIDAIKAMLDKHARRLLVTQSGLVLSDRGIIKWLLSPANMDKLRDAPKEILATKVRAMSEVLHTPSTVKPDTDAATALKEIVKNDAHCVVTSDMQQILTPWDLTVRLLLS
jgi:CBS domain-containing protein